MSLTACHDDLLRALGELRHDLVLAETAAAAAVGVAVAADHGGRGAARARARALTSLVSRNGALAVLVIVLIRFFLRSTAEHPRDVFVGRRQFGREAALAVLAKSTLEARDIRAIGSHGQTVRHRPALRHQRGF